VHHARYVVFDRVAGDFKVAGKRSVHILIQYSSLQRLLYVFGNYAPRRTGTRTRAISRAIVKWLLMTCKINLEDDFELCRGAPGKSTIKKSNAREGKTVTTQLGILSACLGENEAGTPFNTGGSARHAT